MSRTTRTALSRLAALARLALLGTVVTSLLAVTTVTVAVSTVRGELLDAGSHLAQMLGDASPGVRGLDINGQAIQFEVAQTGRSPSQVLDFYEGWCRDRDGRFADQMQELRAGAPATEAELSLWDGTLRAEEDGRGYVACLDTGPGRLSPTDLAARLQEFGESGNVRDLGRFYYVRAERGQAQTRVIAVWVEGDFFIKRMFPAAGDAPGRDVEGVPRPPGSRRVLSAGERDSQYRWAMFDGAAASARGVLTFYRTVLPAAGWRVIAERALASGGHGLVVRRGGRYVVIAVSQGASPRVSLAEVNTKESM